MRQRFVAAIGVAILIVVVAALLKPWPVPVAGQGQTAALKTAWGDPDLQGIWANEYATPLQRPARFASKEFFTEEERAELDNRRAGQRTFSDRSAPRGSEQDVAGAYNAVFQSRRPTGRRTSLVVDPPDGRIPPLTAEVQKRRGELKEFQLALMQAVETCKTTQERSCAGVKHGPPSPRFEEVAPHYVTTFAFLNRANGPEDFGLGERCMGGNLPDFDGYRRIVQSPGAITIFYDVGQGQGWSRTIPITDRPHLPSHVRQWWGDSRGRWEGNTLVVDVTNFSAKTDFQGSRENLHLVERWTRTSPTTLEYAVTIEDPTVWTRPWTVKQEFTRQSEQENRVYYEPRCVEGNFGFPAMMKAARQEDREFAEGRGPDPLTKDNASGGADSDPLQQ